MSQSQEVFFFSFFSNFCGGKIILAEKKEILMKINYTKTHRIYPIFSPKQKFTGVPRNLPKHCT
jgi:hypothetical protein